MIVWFLNLNSQYLLIIRVSLSFNAQRLTKELAFTFAQTFCVSQSKYLDVQTVIKLFNWSMFKNAINRTYG